MVQTDKKQLIRSSSYHQQKVSGDSLRQYDFMVRVKNYELVHDFLVEIKKTEDYIESRRYGQNLEILLGFIERTQDLMQLDKGTLKEIVEMVKLVKNRAGVYDWVSDIRLFYDYCVENNHCDKNPMQNINVPQPVTKKAPLPTLNDEMDVAMALYQFFICEKKKLLKREQAIIALFLFTNMNIADLSFVKAGDCERITKIIKDEKTLQVLDQYIIDMQQELDGGDDMYLFQNKDGQPLTRQYLWIRLKKMMRKVGANESMQPNILQGILIGYDDAENGEELKMSS